MENQVTRINTSPILTPQLEVMSVSERASIDAQVTTAKAYPRDIAKALANIELVATCDRETATECFYNLKRGDTNIEGLSVRFAEIVASMWGNLRVQTQITANDGKMITATAICYDLESNNAVSKSVSRRITDKYGRTYSEDMQIITGNASSAIAYRNAVLTIIPKAILKKAIEKIKDIALGKGTKKSDLPIAERINNMKSYYNNLGASDEELLYYVQRAKMEELNDEDLFTLISLSNAIKEGTTTIEESLKIPYAESLKVSKAKKSQNEVELLINKVK